MRCFVPHAFDGSNQSFVFLQGEIGIDELVNAFFQLRKLILETLFLRK